MALFAIGIGAEEGIGPRALTSGNEYLEATGIRLAHEFRGDSLTDAIGGLVLTPVNAPTVDSLVADTLPGRLVPPIYPNDAPSALWSHAYSLTAINQSFDTAAPGSVAFDDGPVMVHLTLRVPSPQAGLTEFCGNDDASSGVSLRINQPGEFVVEFQPDGGALVGVTLAETGNNDVWYELVAIADRPAGGAGTLRVGTVMQEGTIALGAGTLLSTIPFSLGMFSGASSICQIMGCRIAFGEQVRGKDTSTIAQVTSELLWQDCMTARVSTAAK